jgi:pimeloyl-ACP methyl ester carboxylesterase
MPLFLDVRAASVGDFLANSVAIFQGTTLANYTSITPGDLLGAIQGRHVLVATHGFNVNRADGIQALSNWASLLRLPDPSVFLGLLWPGDSVWLHGLDYPGEPKVADDTGRMIASFIDANFLGAASISFASHSLGARVVLATAQLMQARVRRVILMAGAIDDDCLNTEFRDTTGKIDEISVLASKGDMVLAAAFPLGNFLGGILTKGHPWVRRALGRDGPASPIPARFVAPYQIPDVWNYGHPDYLRISAPPPAIVPLPANVPPQGSPMPSGGASGWHEAFSALFVSTRFK